MDSVIRDQYKATWLLSCTLEELEQFWRGRAQGPSFTWIALLGFEVQGPIGAKEKLD